MGSRDEPQYAVIAGPIQFFLYLVQISDFAISKDLPHHKRAILLSLPNSSPHIIIIIIMSCYFSLSFIASGRSSGLHPVSSHSYCMYVLADRPAFARPYVGVHRSISLMSSFLLLQQYLVRLTWIVFVMGAGGCIVSASWGVAARTCSILLAAFLCNCRLASSPAVLLASK